MAGGVAADTEAFRVAKQARLPHHNIVDQYDPWCIAPAAGNVKCQTRRRIVRQERSPSCGHQIIIT
jgi:hypothetical protein